MNIFFGCQGSITNHFIYLDKLLSKEITNYTSHFWVGDKYEFIKNKYEKYFNDNNIQFLKEWSFTDNLKIVEKDIKEYINSKYSSLNLWNIILADRRLMYGPQSKYRQKYTSRYSFDELTNIIYRSLYTLDKYILENEIDVIVTFVPSCFGTYILNIIAENNNIKLRQLRATKIEDLVIFSDTLSATPNYIKSKYKENLNNFPQIKFIEESKNYILNILKYNAKYTGSERLIENSYLALIRLIKKANQVFKYLKDSDRHNKISLIDLYINKFFISKYKKFRISKIYSQRLFNQNISSKYKVLFYPLNSEPEIAISIHSRNHQNQIETIRRISQSIPLDWILVVKEHPRSVGIRSLKYYKKILEIPNVYFFKNTESIRHCIDKSDAVCTLTGFIGFEALVQKKPVILLGDSFYSSLHGKMIKKIDDMNEFYSKFQELLLNYEYSEKHLISLISAHFEYGDKIDIYKTILNKPVKKSQNNLNYDESMEILKNLFLKTN